MPIGLGTRLRIAIDALRDPLTGRGGPHDRTTRLEGSSATATDNQLYGRYKSNGFMQRLINGLADDSTQAWFEIETDNVKAADALQERYKELDFQKKLREVVKFSSIYPRGAALYMGFESRDIEDQIKPDRPMPKEVIRLSYLNELTSSSDFSVQVRKGYDATKQDYRQTYFVLNGREVHQSRMLWLNREFNSSEAKGISLAQSVFDAVGAQDSALWSVSSIAQVLSVLVFKSDQYLNMDKTKQAETLKKMREWIDTQSAIGLGEKEDVKRLEPQLQGVKDILDFIMQNLAGMSGRPLNVLIGRMQGVLTAADEDQLNYYAAIKAYQEGKLTPLIRQLNDVLLTERSSKVYRLTAGKLDYEIAYNKLWELSPSLQADIEKKDAERDAVAVTSGVIDTEEARQLNPRYYMLEPRGQVAGPREEELEQGQEEIGAAATETEQPSMDVGGKALPASKIALDQAGAMEGFTRFQLRKPAAFREDSFRVAQLDAAGVWAIAGKLKACDGREVQSLMFEQASWTDAMINRYVNASLETDAFDVAPMPEVYTVYLLPWTERHEAPDGSSWLKTVELDVDRGIKALEGELTGNGGTAFFSINFAGPGWNQEKAEDWVAIELPRRKGDAEKYQRAIDRKKTRAMLGEGKPVRDGLTIQADPVETVGTEVRVRVRQPGVFEEGSFRSKVIDKERGIRIIIGRLKGKDATATQSYRFNAKKWTEARAAKWVKDHDETPG